MTAVLILIVLFIGIFFREIIFFGLYALSQNAHKIASEKWTVRLKAEGFLVPTVFLAEASPLESFIIGYGRRLRVLLSESLWNSLDDREKEAALIWASLSVRQSSSWIRGFIDFDCFRTDRDTALFLNESKDWIHALEKVEEIRALHPPSATGSLFLGFSYSGSSLLSEWPKCEARKIQVEYKISKLKGL